MSNTEVRVQEILDLFHKNHKHYPYQGLNRRDVREISGLSQPTVSRYLDAAVAYGLLVRADRASSHLHYIHPVLLDPNI